MVIRHNRLRDEIFDICHPGVSLERGHGLTRNLAHTRPADILIAGWDRGKPAVLDLTITSPLCSAILSELCHQAGAAALAAEVGKLPPIDPNALSLHPIGSRDGASRPTIPSPGWHPTWPFTSPPPS